jgi:hypothetical protein
LHEQVRPDRRARAVRLSRSLRGLEIDIEPSANASYVRRTRDTSPPETPTRCRRRIPNHPFGVCREIEMAHALEKEMCNLRPAPGESRSECRGTSLDPGWPVARLDTAIRVPWIRVCVSAQPPVERSQPAVRLAKTSRVTSGSIASDERGRQNIARVPDFGLELTPAPFLELAQTAKDVFGGVLEPPVPA